MDVLFEMEVNWKNFLETGILKIYEENSNFPLKNVFPYFSANFSPLHWSSNTFSCSFPFKSLLSLPFIYHKVLSVQNGPR